MGVKVAEKTAIPEGKAKSVTVNNKQIAIFNIKGTFYAIDDACTHAGASLAEGEVNGLVVTCPWHGATFQLNSGIATEPAFENVNTYKISINGEDIFIEI